MFKKKKNTQIEAAPEVNTTAEAPAETPEKPEFQKNIKTLWIYTSLFCVFALVLIFVSSFFQERRDKENESLREQVEKHELVLSDNRSTIKNIESEIDAYKQINDKLTQRNDYLEQQADIDSQMLASASEMIENADLLFTVGQCLEAGDTATAQAKFAAIDTNHLSATMRVAYDKYQAVLTAE